jgi:hypothetical protein
MLFTFVMHDYFKWHYTHAWRELFHVWLNFFWFFIHFFSIPQLFSSLFAPWRRITEDRGDKFSLEDLAGFLIINLLSRCVGFVMRLAVISIGLLAITTTFVVGIVTYVFWLAAPIVIITGVLGGVTIIISGLLI